MKWGATTIMMIAALVGLPATPGWAKVKTETVEYKHADTVLEGYLAYDDAFKGRRPGVLVLHEWWGLNDYAKLRARQLAAMGYVALAADLYGKGRRAETPAEAAKLAGRLRKDRKLMRGRALAGLRELKDHKLTDSKKVAAIGYCFGGTAALELARSGAKLQAVVSFHGGLDTPDPADARRIRAKVLVLHGADDPHVSPEQLAAFQKEMRAAKVDWQMNIYGGAVHAFTNPDAGDDPSTGAAYNERAARRSWEAMRLLFAETIGLPARGGGGIGTFAKDKIGRPVGIAGKATGKAAQRAAAWIWGKLRGKNETH